MTNKLHSFILKRLALELGKRRKKGKFPIDLSRGRSGPFPQNPDPLKEAMKRAKKCVVILHEYRERWRLTRVPYKEVPQNPTRNSRRYKTLFGFESRIGNI